MAVFYVVATPIGNLEDITLRALSVLGGVGVILCEDTRMTKRLLDRHSISGKKLITYNEKQSGSTERKIIKLLEEGSDIALVTDAGTPTISDPGARLVGSVRQAGFTLVPIPGANAAITALSASGIPASEFLFLGFLPHKKGRETLFKEIANSKRTVLFYESPHRILKTLQKLKDIQCPSIIVARELTKIHEEIVTGSSEEIFDFFSNHKEKVRGEFVVIVRGNC